ncbi:MAG: permease-like cell division protein FtsX [Gallionellaceae bacterium]|nr:permease-like cell division protein FtsX [Gallionellaceae bacterium]
MKNVLFQHGQVISIILQRLLQNPFASSLNIIVIGIALSLPIGGYVLLKNVQNLAHQLAGTPQISVFLATGTSPDEIARISKQLKEHSAIDRIEFVPRDLALKQLQVSTGLSDVVAGLTQNPLPDAFIIYPTALTSQQLELLRDDLKSWSKLEHVQLDSAWAHKLEALLKFGRLAVFILAALLSFALVAITFNTIRLQILTQREEIEVAKLIGATNGFIRRPFLYFGIIQGLFGGAAAWLIIAFSLLLLNISLSPLNQLYASSFSLQHLSINDSLTLLGFSTYLGWLGAWLSVSQHLWRIEPK